MKWALLLLLSIGGCSSSSSKSNDDLGETATLRVTVTSASTIADVDHFSVLIKAGGQSLNTQFVAPGPLPPSKTLDIAVHAAGTVTLTIEADDAAGKALATGSGSAQATLNQTVELTISLQPV